MYVCVSVDVRGEEKGKRGGGDENQEEFSRKYSKSHK